MKHTLVVCDHCGNHIYKQNRHYNYAKKLGRKMYCDSTCAGNAKMVGERSEKQREAGRAYYKKWYYKNREKILAKRKIPQMAGRFKRVATITVLTDVSILDLPKGGA